MATRNDFMAQLPPITRLSEPAFDEEAARAYREAIEAIEDAGIRYLVGGALALNAHTGIWRDTKDLDVFVRPRDAPATLAALQKADFDTETVYESWLGKAWRGDVFVDLIWRNANAILPVTDKWFENDASIRVFGRDVPVMPVEELLLSKMMVMGRYRYDGADMLHLFFAAGDRIDWDRLARLCGEHAGLMAAHMHTYRWAYPGWAERVPLDVIERFSRITQESDSDFGPFRARLLDIQSFAVDVQEWDMPDPHRQALEDIFGEAEGRS